jgi:alpha-tubulin suppressor-like RCC1 family protein
LGTVNLRDEPFPIQIPLEDRIVDIACGGNHSLFLTYEGRVYATGLNSFGQLGFPSEGIAIPVILEYFSSQNIKINKIAAAHNLSAAVSATGKLFVWGEGFIPHP